MKKILVMVVVLCLVILSFTPAKAGGDKQRGEVGQGSVNQHQVVTPPVPFP